MNYSNIYRTIIENALNHNRKKHKNCYFEKHHIVPKSLGGLNDASNLVLLTAKEHFICHHLLTKIYHSDRKLKFAFWAMCNQLSGDVQRTYKITSSTYETAKINFSQANSIRHKGKKMPKSHSEKSSKRMKENNIHKRGSDSHLFNIPRTHETKSKISSTKLLHPERNANYKGDYITPFGKFGSVPLASKSTNYSADVIRFRCKNSNKTISKTNVKNDRLLSTDDIGKSWLELGWGFNPSL